MITWQLCSVSWIVNKVNIVIEYEVRIIMGNDIRNPRLECRRLKEQEFNMSSIEIILLVKIGPEGHQKEDRIKILSFPPPPDRVAADEQVHVYVYGLGRGISDSYSMLQVRLIWPSQCMLVWGDIPSDSSLRWLNHQSTSCSVMTLIIESKYLTKFIKEILWFLSILKGEGGILASTHRLYIHKLYIYCTLSTYIKYVH